MEVKVKSKTVVDLMVPLAEYATVSQEATLKEVIETLEKTQKEFDNSRDRHRHRAVLVYDENNYIIGKISQLDVLRALEPKYDLMGGSGSSSRFGFSAKFMKSLINQYHLWDDSLDEICKRAEGLKAKTFMYAPTEGEFVDKNASLGEAIHQLILGHHQSLIVTHKKDIIGILRLSDVFVEICNTIKT